MAGNGEKLSRHQERAISALLSNGTIAGAARESGVSEASIRRWMKLPAFKVAYAAARRELVDGTVKMIQKAGQAAFATLVRAMADEKAPWSARANAARTVLELGLRERPVGIHLAASTTTSGISKGLATVIQAAMRGEMTPDEARQVATVFRTQLDAVALAEVERRLAALEGHGRAVADDEDDEEEAA
jgi:hypothetical protein